MDTRTVCRDCNSQVGTLIVYSLASGSGCVIPSKKCRILRFSFAAFVNTCLYYTVRYVLLFVLFLCDLKTVPLGRAGKIRDVNTILFVNWIEKRQQNKPDRERKNMSIM